MKIAIAGTRGIPNNYGGFEQFAQELSRNLVIKGHAVTVFSPSYRNDVNEKWNNVSIKKIACPSVAGSFGHFIYDFLSIRWAVKQKFDVILVCGYVTSFPALWWYRSQRHRLVIHTDGLEWKRNKWNSLTRLIIKKMEKWTSQLAIHLVVDHPVIQEYYKTRYSKEVHRIAYGCDIRENILKPTDEKQIPNSYFLVIARNERENQLELICHAYLKSNTVEELIIFTNKPFKNQNPKIHIILNEYNDEILNQYRRHAKAYIHAYTVGGTNPSLIEAMAYCPLILAFDNEFHRSILEKNAIYFSNEEELVLLLRQVSEQKLNVENLLNANRVKVLENYQWKIIAEQYIHLFNLIMNTYE
jgi:glycosyltransferase involved in cell wall biosynthesis